MLSLTIVRQASCSSAQAGDNPNQSNAAPIAVNDYQTMMSQNICKLANRQEEALKFITNMYFEACLREADKLVKKYLPQRCTTGKVVLSCSVSVDLICLIAHDNARLNTFEKKYVLLREFARPNEDWAKKADYIEFLYTDEAEHQEEIQRLWENRRKRLDFCMKVNQQE